GENSLFSASSRAFDSAQCLVCLTIIALRRSVSFRLIFEKFARFHYRARQHRSGAIRMSASRGISSYRLLSPSKHLFRGFYFDELSGQSRNSGVEAFLLRKVVLKEFTHMNCRDE